MMTHAAARAPFQQLPLEPRTILDRIRGTHPRENAWIEVNNLLAEAASVRSVRPEQVARIAERHEQSFRGEFCSRLERLYRDYLLYCLGDHRLSEEEQADLAHLKRILRLSGTAVASIHESVARRLYEHTVDEMLADGRIDPDERAFLTALQQNLALPRRVAERIIAARQEQHDR